jgi:hypothetical protein
MAISIFIFIRTQNLFCLKTILAALSVAMVTGCIQTAGKTNENVSAYKYAEEVFQGTKSRTEENFKSNSSNFQFVLIGDRTGGANAPGTFKLAMYQINLLQPEFVINAFLPDYWQS